MQTRVLLAMADGMVNVEVASQYSLSVTTIKGWRIRASQGLGTI